MFMFIKVEKTAVCWKRPREDKITLFCTHRSGKQLKNKNGNEVTYGLSLRSTAWICRKKFHVQVLILFSVLYSSYSEIYSTASSGKEFC